MCVPGVSNCTNFSQKLIVFKHMVHTSEIKRENKVPTQIKYFHTQIFHPGRYIAM
jgi:hypothetical protein